MKCGHKTSSGFHQVHHPEDSAHLAAGAAAEAIVHQEVGEAVVHIRPVAVVDPDPGAVVAIDK